MDQEQNYGSNRASFYGSPAFRAVATQLFGSASVETLDEMLRQHAFPEGPEPSGDILALEGALVIAAMATSRIRRASVADAARALLAMEYQLEYGSKAARDRKGLRDASQPPHKDFLGSQLASGLRQVGLSRNSDASASSHRFSVTVGWTPPGDCVGLMHYASKGATLGYSTAHLIRNTNPGVVRITHLEFDLSRKFEMSESEVARFAEVMFSTGARAPRAADG
jgi:hypothetical protein